MSERKNDGGPAFPQFELVSGERDGHGDVIDAYSCATGGMSLRDWFAGQSLTGLLHPAWDANAVNNPEMVANHAYELSDAMLSARMKGTSK